MGKFGQTGVADISQMLAFDDLIARFYPNAGLLQMPHQYVYAAALDYDVVADVVRMPAGEGDFVFQFVHHLHNRTVAGA